MQSIDFKSPVAETLVLSRLPCQPLCSLARAVVVHKLQRQGLNVARCVCPSCSSRGSSVPLPVTGIFVPLRWRDPGPNMFVDPSMQVKLTVDDFWRLYENSKLLQVSVVATALLCRIPSPQRYATVTNIWARLRPSPQC